MAPELVTSSLAIAMALILVVCILMAMTGRVGGNFYAPILVACGLPMLQAATTAQCVLFSAALAAALAFQRKRAIDWKLALVIDPPTDVMALVGGAWSRQIRPHALRRVFAHTTFAAALFMAAHAWMSAQG